MDIDVSKFAVSHYRGNERSYEPTEGLSFVGFEYLTVIEWRYTKRLGITAFKELKDALRDTYNGNVCTVYDKSGVVLTVRSDKEPTLVTEAGKRLGISVGLEVNRDDI